MLKRNRMVMAIFCVLLAAPLVSAQSDESSKKPQESKSPAQAAAPEAALPAAKPADVSSIDAIMAATYAVISGPAGEKRDWDRFRSLFIPGARLVPSGPKKEGGGYFAKAVTPDEYAGFADAYFQKESFYEREAARHTDRFGNIAQVFSTYESRHDAKDPKPFARGINSFQLFYDGTRWWIVTIYWQEESPDAPLPKEFLPAAK